MRVEGEDLSPTKGETDMASAIQWEASLTKAKAKAKKGGKLILIDFYNNL